MVLIKKISIIILLIGIYILSQFIGSLIEFIIFGSGNGINGYDLFIPTLILIFTFLIFFYLKKRLEVLNNNLLFSIIILSCLFIFIFQYIL